MKSVTLNVQVDEYTNKILDVTKAVYGLSNKSEAVNKIVHEFGPAVLEPELRDDFAKEVLEGTEAWEKKYKFRRKMTLEELNEL